MSNYQFIKLKYTRKAQVLQKLKQLKPGADVIFACHAESMIVDIFHQLKLGKFDLMRLTQILSSMTICDTPLEKRCSRLMVACLKQSQNFKALKFDNSLQQVHNYADEPLIYAIMFLEHVDVRLERRSYSPQTHNDVSLSDSIAPENDVRAFMAYLKLSRPTRTCIFNLIRENDLVITKMSYSWLLQMKPKEPICIRGIVHEFLNTPFMTNRRNT